MKKTLKITLALLSLLLACAMVLSACKKPVSTDDTSDTTAAQTEAQTTADTTAQTTQQTQGSTETSDTEDTSSSEDDDQTQAAIVVKSANVAIDENMLKYIYGVVVENFFNSYEPYLEYLNIDRSKPFRNQVINETAKSWFGATEENWFEYFLNVALDDAQQVVLYCEAAKQDGAFERFENQSKATVDAAVNAVKAMASFEGYDDVNKYIEEHYGKNVTTTDIERYMRLAYVASEYAMEKMETIKASITKEQVLDYCNKNDVDMSDTSITVKLGVMVAGKTGSSVTKADFDSMKTTINGLLAAGELSDSKFISLASSIPAATSMIMEDVSTDIGVDIISNWALSNDRQVGDIEVLEDETMYYLLYFIDFGNPSWFVNAKGNLFNEAYETYTLELEQTIGSTIQVDKSAADNIDK